MNEEFDLVEIIKHENTTIQKMFKNVVDYKDVYQQKIPIDSNTGTFATLTSKNGDSISIYKNKSLEPYFFHPVFIEFNNKEELEKSILFFIKSFISKTSYKKIKLFIHRYKDENGSLFAISGSNLEEKSEIIKYYKIETSNIFTNKPVLHDCWIDACLLLSDEKYDSSFIEKNTLLFSDSSENEELFEDKVFTAIGKKFVCNYSGSYSLAELENGNIKEIINNENKNHVFIKYNSEEKINERVLSIIKACKEMTGLPYASVKLNIKKFKGFSLAEIVCNCLGITLVEDSPDF